jgi:hypothetical protein
MLAASCRIQDICQTGIFLNFFYFFYYIHCLICRPSDSTVSEDAGIEPRTVATLALTARRSDHLARLTLTARSSNHLTRSHLNLAMWMRSSFVDEI